MACEVFCVAGVGVIVLEDWVRNCKFNLCEEWQSCAKVALYLLITVRVPLTVGAPTVKGTLTVKV